MRCTTPIAIGAALAAAGCTAETGPGWEPPALVINEFLASNQTGLTAEDGSYPDWIELHNLGDEAVDLSGFALTDDLALPQRWSFPVGARIEAGGYLIVFASGDPSTTTELHASFALSRLGEEIALYGPPSQDLPLLDSVYFDEQQVDVSLARQPDGVGPFAPATEPTPGQPNDGP